MTTMVAALVAAVLAMSPPCGEIASETERRWYEAGPIVLVHFGLSTYLGGEPATRDIPAEIFRPGAFDADRLVAEARDAGAGGLMLMVRDVDRFALWPTTGGRSVAGSGLEPLRELGEACRREGVPFGIAFALGDGMADREALREALAGPWPVDAVALGSFIRPESPPRREALDAAIRSIRELRPEALVVSMSDTDDLPVRALPLRPYWNWRRTGDEDLLGLPDALDRWYASATRGELALVGIPLDREGRWPSRDLGRLRELRQDLDALVAVDLAASARVTASSGRAGGPGPDAPWIAADDDPAPELLVELERPETINAIDLRTPPALGDRAAGFRVEVRTGGAWREVARGERLGLRRLVRFPTETTDAVRLRFDRGPCSPTLARLALHAAPPVVRVAGEPLPKRLAFRGTLDLPLASDHPDATVLRTLDGRDPRLHGIACDGPLRIGHSGRLRAIARGRDGRFGPEAGSELVNEDGVAYLEPIHLLAPPLPGLRLRLYGQSIRRLDELDDGRPDREETIDRVRLPADRPADEFALVFDGYLDVPVDGLYTFSLRSDDGSRLFVHGRLTVNRDGLSHYDPTEGRLALRAGLHPIRVEYFEAKGRESLSLRWSGPDFNDELVPADRLFR